MKLRLFTCTFLLVFSLAGAAKVDDILFEARGLCSIDSFAQALLLLDEEVGKEGLKDSEEFLLELEKGDILLYYSRLPENAAKVYEGLIELKIPKGMEGEIYYRLGLAFEHAEKFTNAARAYEKVVTDYAESSHYDDALTAIERCFLKNYEVRVAVVDGYPISQLELDEIISKLSPAEQKEASTPEGRAELVDRVVYERLLKLAAARAYAPADSTEITIKLSCKSCRPKKILVPGASPDPQLADQLVRSARRVLIDKLYNLEVLDKVEVTEKGKKRYYKDNPDRFFVEAKYTVHELVTDSVKLDSVLQMLASEVPFDSVARSFSIASSASRGGSLGSRGLDKLTPAMQPVAETLSVGTYSEPFWTDRGWELILLEEFTDSYQRSYDEVSSWIEDILKREMIQELSDGALQRFRVSAGVETDFTPYILKVDTSIIDSVEVIDSFYVSDTLARVAGIFIMEKDIDAYIANLSMQVEGRDQDTVFRNNVLAQLIDDKVFAHELAQQKLFLSDSLTNMIDSRSRQMIVNAFVREEIEAKAEVTDEEIEVYYKENKQSYWKPAEAKVREILVSDEDSAKMIIELFEDGTPFDSLARVYSEAETSQRSGYVGYIKKGESGKPYEKQAFKVKEGSVSKPIKTDEGYWIISVDTRKKAFQQTLEQSTGQIRQKLYNSKKEAAENALKESLLSAAEVEIFAEPAPAFTPEEPEEEPEESVEPGEE